MATSLNTTYIPATFKTLGGGLNSTSGSLSIDDSESSDLLNVDFNKFGSILKRNGYTLLNTIPLSGTSQGLHWYQGLFGEYAVTVNNGKVYKMDNLDGVWDDISGGLNIGGVQDTYTTLMLKFDGLDQGTTFTDNSTSTKTVYSLSGVDSYTALLTHFDGAQGATTLTATTGQTITFAATSSLTTATYKFGVSSLGLNGTTDYVTLPDEAGWFWGSENFTVDFYVKFNSVASQQVLFSQVTDANTYMVCYKNPGSGQIVFTVSSASSFVGSWNTSASEPEFNTTDFHHIAIVRSGSTPYIFVDGVSKTLTIPWPLLTFPNITGTFRIGYDGTVFLSYLNGWVDEFRVSKGIARWTSDFTPWKAPYADPYTVTDIKQLGTASAEIKDGASLYLTTSTDWSMSTSNFTIDFWCNFNNLIDSQVLLGQYKSGTQHWYIKKGTNALGNKLQMVFVDTTTKSDYTLSSSWSVAKEEWHHLAFIRSSTVGTIYIDGVSKALVSTTAFGTNDVGMFTDTNLLIGCYSGTSYMSGYIDSLRFSKGTVRWTSNFTPPIQDYGQFLNQDMETFLGYTLGTDQENIPWSWAAQNTTASNITVPTSLTGSKFIKKFQNYCFLGNVKLSGIRYPSRVYWSSLQNFNAWDDAEYIDISRDDGQEITGIKELADRLVIYKNHSIYVIIFTGDADIPFIVQKTNSAVGCSAPFSIQANENGHIFAGYDGVYFFDGVNSYKLSDRINETYSGINHEELDNATSLYQKEKNKYWLSLASGTSAYNNFILCWDSFLNAWSKYDGFSVSNLSLFLVNNTEERPYFSDYNGYYYRADNGQSDNSSRASLPINSYFYTNWKYYETLCDKKGIPHVYISHRAETATTLTMKYSYDFFNGDQYTQTFSAASTLSVTALTTRRDLTGRGRFVRIGIANNDTDSPFRIDGIGTYVTREGMS